MFSLLTWQAEVEETLKRIQSQKGVQGIIIANAEGMECRLNVIIIACIVAVVLFWKYVFDICDVITPC